MLVRRASGGSGLGPLGGYAAVFCSADVIIYNAAISACERGEQWQQAFGLLEVMQQAAALPNVVSYYSAISACEKVQQWQQALVLWL